MISKIDPEQKGSFDPDRKQRGEIKEEWIQSDDMKENRRVFIIGIDGGTWDVLDPLMKDGTMPQLALLAREGVRGVLNSTIPPETAPAWASFQTGVLPGKHGIFEFYQHSPEDYNPVFVDSGKIPLPTLWDLAGRSGKKLLVVNVPLTYPPRKINGCMITGLLTPSTQSRFTHPPELSQEILSREKDYAIAVTQETYNRMDLEPFLDRLIAAEETRTRTMLHLMDHHAWDIAMLHFHSTDPLQHALYRHLDPSRPDYDPDTHRRLKRFYRALDDCLAGLIRSLPPDALKVIVSDHGFCSVYKTININNFLVSENFMVLKNRGFFNRKLLPMVKILRTLDKKLIRVHLSPSRRAALSRKFRMEKFIDWSQTSAFMLNGWLYGFIYLNLLGRERRGIVASGEPYESLRRDLMRRMLDIRDPETGEPVIQNVFKREDLYTGPFLSQAPDLVVVPRQGYAFSRSFTGNSDDLFTLNRLKRDHTGTHRPEGIFLFHGVDVDRSASIRQAGIVDVFPSILHYAGIDIPSYSDGKVLTEIFTPDFQRLNPLRPRSGDTLEEALSNPEQAFSEKDRLQIEKRLRDLGYM